MSIMAVDLGTSRIKVALYNEEGKQLAIKKIAAETKSAGKGQVEIEPFHWWDKFLTLCQAFSTKELDSVERLAVTGQTRAQILLDKQGDVVRPAILWSDTRASVTANRLAKELSPAEIEDSLGYSYPLSASTWPVRMVWLQENEPQNIERTEKVIQPKDYLNYCLTGNICTDITSSLGFIRLPAVDIALEFLRKLRIDPDLIPEVKQPFTVIGHLRVGAAKKSGLPPGIPVIAGAMDSWCDLLGTGAIEEGEAIDIGGTSEVVGQLGVPVSIPENLITLPYLRDLMFVGGPMQNGGSCYRWFNSLIADFSHAKELPARRKIFFLPFLQGERTPYWDSDLRGGFWGLTADSTAEDLLWAVMAGVSCSIRFVLESARELTGVELTRVRIAGGTSNNEYWNQIKANFLGVPVVKSSVRDTALMGVAMLAAINRGDYRDPVEVVRNWTAVEKIYEPDNRRIWFDEYYQIYLDLVEKNREFSHGLKNLENKGRQDRYNEKFYA